MKNFILLFLLVISTTLVSQNVGVGTTTPDASAKLEVASNNSGVLIPRMTNSARNAIASPATSLLIYNTSTKRFEFFNGSSWNPLDTYSPSDRIIDTDSDTYIQVVNLSGQDYIRMVSEGSIFLSVYRNANGIPRIEIYNAATSLAIGDDAGASLQTGSRFNTLIGKDAGKASTGDNNTFVGTESGESNSSGSNNVLIGYQTGQSGSGSSNTYIGHETGKSSTGSGNVFLGNEAGQNELGSNKLYIENSNSSSPLILGDFANDNLQLNADVDLNKNNLKFKAGTNNSAAGAYSFAMGFLNKADASYSTAFGSQNNNLGSYSLVNGSANENSVSFSTILGNDNTNEGAYSLINGFQNINYNSSYALLSGRGNTDSVGLYSTLLGYENTLYKSGRGALVVGYQNEVEGLSGFVHGFQNTVKYRTNLGYARAYVMGHYNNVTDTEFNNDFWNFVFGSSNTYNHTTTEKDRNFIVGYNNYIKDSHQLMMLGESHNVTNINNCAVLGNALTLSNVSNRFYSKFISGHYLYTGTSTGAYLPAGSGSWASLSDKYSKDNFEEVDGHAVLEKLSTVPVNKWKYKEENDSIRHIGPMAQDFHAAFGLGDSDKSISNVDADGINLAAIKALDERTKEMQALIELQQEQFEAQQKLIQQLTAELTTMKNNQASAKLDAKELVLPKE